MVPTLLAQPESTPTATVFKLILKANIPIVSVTNFLVTKRKLVSISMKISKRSTITSKVKTYSSCLLKTDALCTAHTDPLEKEIAELAESIFAVKAQQEYIVVRERQHRDSKA